MKAFELPSPHFIFNHVPKTGGMSLLHWCRQNLDSTEISPHLTDGEIRLAPAGLFETYRLVAGHFTILTQMGFCRSRYSITLLRNPIRRIFSAYHFWRIAKEKNILTSKAQELSFADFVDYFLDSPAVIHNPYCHHFASIGRDCPAYPADSKGVLDTAKHNLAAFDFVGICEEFDQSFQYLSQELGWRLPVAVPHENRSHSETCFFKIDSRTMDVLQERTELDSQLYEFALEMLRTRRNDLSKGSPSFETIPERNRFISFPQTLVLDRRATILNVSAVWANEASSQLLELAIVFITRAPIPDLSLGIQISDRFGSVMGGTNTENEGLNLGHNPGTAMQAAFRLDCNLVPGQYFVTVALSESRRLGFHEHWIDHAALFNVHSNQAAPTRSPQRIQLRGFYVSSV